MDYMTLKEASEKWSIPDTVKMAGVQLIPKEAEKTIDERGKLTKNDCNIFQYRQSYKKGGMQMSLFDHIRKSGKSLPLPKAILHTAIILSLIHI